MVLGAVKAGSSRKLVTSTVTKRAQSKISAMTSIACVNENRRDFRRVREPFSSLARKRPVRVLGITGFYSASVAA